MMNRKAFKVLGVIIGIAGLMTLMLLLGIDIGRYENDEKNTQSQTVRKSADQEGSVIDYVNELREANGLPHLLEDVKLDASAKLKAEDMETKDYFEHTSPWGGDAMAMD